jgi:hypothetical protein
MSFCFINIYFYILHFLSKMSMKVRFIKKICNKIQINKKILKKCNTNNKIQIDYIYIEMKFDL